MASVVDDPTALCAPYVDATGLDGASITSFGSGARAGAETIAASDATAARIDELQLDLGVGPSWDAVARQVVQRVPHLADDERWPVLRDATVLLGVGALFAFPVAFGGVSIGAVTTYAARSGDLDERLVDTLVAQTRVTAMLLMSAAVSEASREVSANPRSRRIVHQATGMVLARFGLEAPDALALLQAHAFSLGLPVAQVAADIVEGRSHFLDPSITVVEAGGEEPT